jgi:hypothetical protein
MARASRNWPHRVASPCCARRSANAIAARSRRSVRRECLDHLLPLGAATPQVRRAEYVAYFNEARPHQGRGPRVLVPDEPRV